MYKITKGYLLLFMLVVTGLAGRLHSVTLSGKERSYLVAELKTSRTLFLSSINNLSPKQLAFKPSKTSFSINDYICEAGCLQKRLWLTLQRLVEKPLPNRLYALPVKDEEIRPAIISRLIHDTDLCSSEQPLSPLYALPDFKNCGSDLHRFARTTTENLRSYTCTTASGTLDAYQLLLATPPATGFIQTASNSLRLYRLSLNNRSFLLP